MEIATVIRPIVCRQLADLFYLMLVVFVTAYRRVGPWESTSGIGLARDVRRYFHD